MNNLESALVSYGYVFNELLALTIHGRLIRLILIQTSTVTSKKHLVIKISMHFCGGVKQ